MLRDAAERVRECRKLERIRAEKWRKVTCSNSVLAVLRPRAGLLLRVQRLGFDLDRFCNHPQGRRHRLHQADRARAY